MWRDSENSNLKWKAKISTHRRHDPWSAEKHSFMGMNFYRSHPPTSFLFHSINSYESLSGIWNGQTTAQSAVCRIVQCNQRGVTPSETNIARLGWFRFHYFCLLHLLHHYPSGIQQKIKIKGTALHRTNLSHCNGTMGE